MSSSTDTRAPGPRHQPSAAVAAALALLRAREAGQPPAPPRAVAHRGPPPRINPKRKALLPPPARRLSADSTRWVYEALILPITRLECACGAVSETIGGKLLLRRRDKVTGAIWESADGATCNLPPLPRRRRVHSRRVEACPKCFSGLTNLEHIACLIPILEHPVPVFDTPAAYVAASAIAKMRPLPGGKKKQPPAFGLADL